MALFVSLVLLLVLTIIGVSAVQTTTLETRMSRNEHDSLLAFQAAESALRDAEVVVEALTNIAAFTNSGAGGMWTVAPAGTPDRWTTAANWSGGSVTAATALGAPVAQQPSYMIEWLATVVRPENAYQMHGGYGNNVSDSIEVFRVTARGVGGNPTTQVMLQSTYGVVLN